MTSNDGFNSEQLTRLHLWRRSFSRVLLMCVVWYILGSITVTALGLVGVFIGGHLTVAIAEAMGSSRQLFGVFYYGAVCGAAIGCVFGLVCLWRIRKRITTVVDGMVIR